MEQDYTEIRDKRIRTEICKLMSEMLDNPNKSGIYPTSKFMWEMETFILVEKHLTEDVIVVCTTASAKSLTEDELMEEAMGGYGGNSDDAFNLGFSEGRADMAGEIIAKLNA